MSNWKPINLLERESELRAAVLNEPTSDISNNLDYLKQRYDALTADGNLQAVFLNNVETTDVSRWDIVYLDQENELVDGVYKKALATHGSFDEFKASRSSYAVGIVTDIAATTIAVYGKVDFPTDFDFSSILESGETIKSGPYYLSSREAGKLTASPNTVETYVGWIHTGETPFIILAPRLQDTGRAHVHRTYSLKPSYFGDYMIQDADGNAQSLEEATPSSVHRLVGHPGGSLGSSGGLVTSYGELSRLKLYGEFNSSDNVVYDFHFSGSSNPASTIVPTNFSSAYFHWTSDRDGEGYSRVLGFGIPFIIGTHGLIGVMDSNWASDDSNWNKPSLGVYPVQRWYDVEIPTDVMGWKERGLYEKFTRTSGTADVYLVGGPFTSRIKYSNEFRVETYAFGGETRAFVQDRYSGAWETISSTIVIAPDGTQAYKHFELDNGASIIFVGNVTASEVHELTYIDEAPLAKFEYLVNFHKPMDRFFPPIPRRSCAFVLNGVELEQYDYTTGGGSYLPTSDSLVWASNLYNDVPFELSTADYHVKTGIFAFIRTNLKHSNYVTSLRASEDSPFKFVAQDSDEEIDHGALELKYYPPEVPENVSKIIPGPGISVLSSTGTEEGKGVVSIGLSDNYITRGDFKELELWNYSTDEPVSYEYIRYLSGIPYIYSQGEGEMLSAYLTVPSYLPLSHNYKLLIYSTVFAYNVAPSYTGTERLELETTCNVLTDRFRTYGVSMSGSGSFDNDITTLGPSSGYYDISLEESGYYQSPILIHNNTAYDNLTGIRYRAIPDFDHVFKSGDRINIRMYRKSGTGDYSGESAPESYTSRALGFINLRWELVDLTTLSDVCDVDKLFNRS